MPDLNGLQSVQSDTLRSKCDISNSFLVHAAAHILLKSGATVKLAPLSHMLPERLFYFTVRRCILQAYEITITYALLKKEKYKNIIINVF